MALELLYHRLVYDEPADLAEFDQRFRDARRNRRLNVCNTLVQMAREQWQTLSVEGQATLEYFDGLLAFHLKKVKDAKDKFHEIDAN